MSAVQNIAAYLPDMAARQPDALAVAVQGKRAANGRHVYTELTAAELDRLSNRAANGLREAGIGPGVRTVLMVTPGVEFFVLTFALFKAGAIPVLVDPGMGVKNLKACLAEAEPEAFVGITKAHAARVILGWARSSVTKNVTVGPRLFWGGQRYADVMRASDDPIMAEGGRDEVAAILFTSGSTGIPKGAVYTHGNFIAQVEALRDHYGIEPGERDLATFPLFALFGPALGMAAIVPDMDASKPITADPENLIAAIQDYEATNLFASPALIEKVGRHGVEHGTRLPSIRRVISAGAPAEPPSLQRFATMLAAGVEVLPSYGATEALPVATIGHTELIADTADRTARGEGLCVGRPVGDIDIRIAPITDEAIKAWNDTDTLPTGEIGEICVRGPVVTREYFRKPDATRLAKIPTPDGAIYHRMGDVGYLDDTGRLWFCGRKAHRVVLPDTTLFTIPCERVFNEHPQVRRTALVGVERGGKTIPVLCVELENGLPYPDKDKLFGELKTLGETTPHTRRIETFLIHPQFPTDVRHNAKIFREALAVWAEQQLS